MKLKAARQAYQPICPDILKNLLSLKCFEEKATHPSGQLKSLFPKTWESPFLWARKGRSLKKKSLRVGVLFSGGQAAGGHNVIAGLFDALQALSVKMRLIGFLGGPSGLISGKSKEITKQLLKPYRNQGGFDLIGSGRTKIASQEQLEASLKSVTALHLDGLVIIGGDDSNTTAAILAEYFKSQDSPVSVIGVPKTIDGDLQHPYAPISFGFDTACKTYSEVIGNLGRDALSARKYYHFVKLMGRSASHVALECALNTHPNLTLIGEEVAAHKRTLPEITKTLVELIVDRASLGKNFGLVLIPEGLIEFVPDIKDLIAELNLLLSQRKETVETVVLKLSAKSKACFLSLPLQIQHELLAERDSHGNVNVSLIETEKLLIHRVQEELAKRGDYTGSFNPVSHFLGYEGRSAYPSNFDCNYCYALGRIAAVLIHQKRTGYMVCIPNLKAHPKKWKAGGIPLTTMLHLEMRKGQMKPVIAKTLVDLKGSPYRDFVKKAHHWRLEDDYQFPGPIQFFGDPRLTDSLPLSISED